MHRILCIFLFFISVLFACKKSDVVADDDSGNNNNSSVVYNVHKATLLQLIKATLLQLINDVRAKECTCGSTVMPAVAAVVWNDQLAKAAYDHSVDMNKNDYFSHTGLNGSNPGQRINAAGYAWTSYGENIAQGYTSEQTVINAWLASEGHCKNIMNAGFKDMGVGRDGNYWAQEFGSK